MTNNQTPSLAQQAEYLLDFVTENKRSRIDNVLSERTRHLSVVLENVYQAHNISAVIRSCDCFGIQDLHIIENNNAFKINDDIALGASQWVDTSRYKQGSRHCLENLKQKGYQIAALSLQEPSIPLAELDITQKTALCIGTELTGLSDEAHELADVFVKVPMVGFTQSFNLSVTAALCMYELSNRLKSSNIDWQLTEKEKLTLTINWCQTIIPNGDKILNVFNKNS